MWLSREERREGERRESVKNGTRQSRTKNPKEKENTALTGSDRPRILISQAIRASDSSEKTNGKKTRVCPVKVSHNVTPTFSRSILGVSQ